MTSQLLTDRIKKVSKKALIITDGTELMQEIAGKISAAITDYNVKICPVDKFDGTDLLPAEIFIIGCEKAKPPSFAYLEEMLFHINLAARKCGLFSSNEKALKYLRSIIKDCEAGTGDSLLVEDGKIKKSQINNWLKSFIC